MSGDIISNKYPALSLVDALISDAGTYPRAKVCLQISL